MHKLNTKEFQRKKSRKKTMTKKYKKKKVKKNDSKMKHPQIMTYKKQRVELFLEM